MARTAEILKDIAFIRTQISDNVDLISRQRNSEIAELIKEKPLESTVGALLLGFLAAIFFGRTIKIIRFILFLYTIKQSMSFLFQRR